MRIDLVEQRKKYMNNSYINESFVNTKFLENKCIENPNDFNSFEKIINNYNESNSFINLLEVAIKSNYKKTMISRLHSIIIRESNIDNIVSAIKNKKDESLNSLLEKANDIKCCDRILINENTIENLIDINKIVKESKLYTDDDKITLIEELCYNINSFNCDSKIRLNLCLENIPYILYKKSIKLDEDIIYETIYDYFKDKEDIDFVLEVNNSFFKKSREKVNKSINSNIKSVKNKLLQLKNIKTPEPIKQVLRFMYTQSPDQILDDIPNFLTWLRTFLAFSTFAINPYLGIVIMIADQFIAHNMKISETDRCIKKFEKEKEKCERKIERLSDTKAKNNLEEYIKTLDKSIDKLNEYRNNLKEKELGDDNDMLDEMNVEKMKEIDYYNEGVRGYMPYLINESTFYKNYKDRYDKQYIKLCNEINNYSNSYKPLKGKVHTLEEFKLLKENLNLCLLPEGNIYLELATFNSNNTDVERCMKHIEKSLDDRHSIYTENVGGHTTNAYLISNYIIEDANPIHKDLIVNTDLIEESVKALEFLQENSDKIFIEQLDNAISYLDDRDIRNISKIANSNPFINRDNYNYTITEAIDYREFGKARALKEATKYINNKDLSLLDILILKESAEEIKEAFELINVNEGANTIRNNLMIVKEKIKKNAQKLSDKDKQYSRQLDNIVDRMISKTQKELTNKNREAVIKGSLLPSFSAAIKLAMASGVASIVNPVLGIITLVGGIGAAKVGTKKEQQYILDEIEIELKLVDKKIQLAERNDDTKALEQLYRIEKQLKREQTRIKYHKKDFRPVQDN